MRKTVRADLTNADKIIVGPHETGIFVRIDGHGGTISLVMSDNQASVLRDLLITETASAWVWPYTYRIEPYPLTFPIDIARARP